jgi:nicotinamidase-related amidase
MMAKTDKKKIIEGNPVLVVIDVQKGSFMPSTASPIAHMPGYDERVARIPSMIKKARLCGIPIVFFQEAHRRDMIDFGRELDGDEDVHCLEGNERTEIADEVGMTDDDYFIRKRRYSGFFGTDFEILLKGLKADTLIFVGVLTDVCVHYTFVDGHQHDYYCRVIEDCVAGSSEAAHEASLSAMEYLQTGARRTSDEALEAFNQYQEKSS